MKTIAIASGKGGVGKTTLTANLGIALAQAGQRVVLFDGDLGLANLDIVLGLKSDVTVHHVVEGIISIPEAAVQGPAGIRVVNGCSGVACMLRLSRKRLEALLLQTADFESTTDILVFDTASGADARVMTFLTASDEVVLVTTPDPTSVVDCYSTAKVLFRHKKDAAVSIVVNMAEDAIQAQKAFETLESSTTRFLHKSVGYLGCVRKDAKAAEIARSRRSFVLASSHLAASHDIKTIADSLVKAFAGEQIGKPEYVLPSADARAA